MVTCLPSLRGSSQCKSSTDSTWGEGGPKEEMHKINKKTEAYRLVVLHVSGASYHSTYIKRAHCSYIIAIVCFGMVSYHFF